MKRLATFIVVLVIGVTALYFSQRRHEPTPVSANAVVAVAADAQRDAHVTNKDGGERGHR